MPPAMMAPPPNGVHPEMPNSYYPEGPNDITGGLPINLDSLRDGPPGSKPFYPYSTLIRYAIKGSPNQKLLLEDIYYAIESRFPYFRTAPSGWKNSVRHNLSLNPCFEKVARPLTDRGKGSYWTVNDNVDPRTGVHRVRKKKPKGGRGRGGAQIIEDRDIDEYIPTDGPPPPQAFDDPHAFPPPPMGPDGAGPSKLPYPPPYPFDPAFPMMPQGIRFAPPPLPTLPEDLEVDENGNVDWHLAWIKELQTLHNMTEEQEKGGMDQEWYRQMLFRVRSVMLLPALPPGELAGPPPPMPPADPGEVPPEGHEPA
ncbi:hypothetical protein EVG20_g915 [Dentipellis fragilis]|uniref:Fork-head domain-containing protein n=1 Tax=Dentipellis fragilis TaxID=205917 RepID=A0A4Y9ZDS3_9AGAM|nr:hypothetical protein EVG20_g915 [Dentipellis fragilis]